MLPLQAYKSAAAVGEAALFVACHCWLYGSVECNVAYALPTVAIAMDTAVSQYMHAAMLLMQLPHNVATSVAVQKKCRNKYKIKQNK